MCYSKSPMPSMATMLMPPGSFEYYGVPFHVSEMTPGGFFQKTFAPDQEQQFLLQMAIVGASPEAIGSVDAGQSINEAPHNDSDLRIKMDGWLVNPVEPTLDEIQNSGGWGRWTERGGFPISLKVATGQYPVTTKAGFALCASIKCACPQDDANWQGWRDTGLIDSDQQVHAVPRCIGAVLNQDGIQTGVSELSNMWSVYVAAIPGQYTMKITHNDPSVLEKFAVKMAAGLRALITAFCGNQQPIKNELKKSAQESCITKDQKPCTKGTVGCTCTQPSEASKANVTAFNVWATTACSAWGIAQATEEQLPQYEAPAIPQVPKELAKKPCPWGLALAGGAAAIGVAAFLLRPH